MLLRTRSLKHLPAITQTSKPSTYTSYLAYIDRVSPGA
nr:MAG TPA: hypothetical protein [Caudoviricetes sp.]